MNDSNRIVSFFLSIVMIIVALPLSRFETFALTEGDFSYTVLSEADKTAELSGYLGSDENVSIPSFLNGYKIVSIGESAFDDANSIVNITIPDTVEEINTVALVHCAGISSFSVASTSQHFESENGVLFDKGKTQLIRYPAASENTSYTVPNTVSTIGPMAFALCQNLSTVTIPNGVEYITDYAFAYSSIQSIIIPDSVFYLGSYAFYYCSMLESVTLSENLDSILENTFEECSSLQNIDVPQSVTVIGNYAFLNCSSLQAVTGMEGVETIGERAFVYCSMLSSISLGSNLSTIDSVVFAGCSSLQSITIPSSLSVINSFTFQACSSLNSVIIEDGVTEIKSGAFWNCGFTSITIPSSVNSIDADAFINNGSTSLKTIYGYAGSYAETYASDYGFVFVDVSSLNIPGDMNNDFVCNNTDLDIMMKIVSGVRIPTQTQLNLGDVNADGVIDGFDIAELDVTLNTNNS